MDKEILLRKLIYRSTHRGCKETDILLGNFFVAKHLEFDDEKLQLYQQFIEEDDVFIYDWIMQKVEPVYKYVGLVEEIRKFHSL